MATQLTDKSIMPWGVHKGKQMADVPASYLLWCYENNKISDDVKEYVEDNLEVLKQQRAIKENDIEDIRTYQQYK